MIKLHDIDYCNIMVGDKSPVSKSFRSLFSGVSCLVNRRVASGGGSRWDDHSLHGALKCATNFYPASKIFSARISNACVSASDSSLPHEQVENLAYFSGKLLAKSRRKCTDPAWDSEDHCLGT